MKYHDASDLVKLRELRRRRQWLALRRHRERLRRVSRVQVRGGQRRPHAEPYVVATRSWAASLLFVGPMLMVYEVGVVLARTPYGTEWRTGADAWVRQTFQAAGLGANWLPPLLLMAVLVGGWAIDRNRERRPRPSLLPGMALESLALGAGLIGLNRLCSLGFDMLQGGSIALQAGTGLGPTQADLAPWLAFLGAGIYEEALFRLAMLPAIYQALRLLHAPALLAATCAVTGSSLAFSLAHHAGATGEPFAWYAFFFRWLAGTYFAWVCCARGFGIAVGAHVAYDVGVGGLDAML